MTKDEVLAKMGEYHLERSCWPWRQQRLIEVTEELANIAKKWPDTYAEALEAF